MRYNFGIHPFSHGRILQTLMKNILPKMVEENGDCKDAVLLYLYLLTYTDNRETMKNGKPNPKMGLAYPSFDKIVSDTKISRRRVKPLTDVLIEYGLLEVTQILYKGKYRNFYRIIDPRDDNTVAFDIHSITQEITMETADGDIDESTDVHGDGRNEIVLGEPPF